MRGSRTSWTERALRRLVSWLPAQFRFDFKSTIEADLDERLRDGDRAGLLRREVPSLLTAIVREHATSLAGGLRQDIRDALRTMRRTPGFSAIAILMLALGTGVNAALFSVIDAVLLQEPFPHSEQVAIVRAMENGKPTAAIPRDRFDALAASPGPLRALAGFTLGAHILTNAGDPRRIDVECVTPPKFDVLGVRPMIGRTFTASEDRPGADPVAVLAYDFWKALGGSLSIVGSTLTINQTSVTVVGVMPRSFAGPFSRRDVTAWLPLRRPIQGGGATGCGNSKTINAFARVGEGLTVATAPALSDGWTLISLTETTLSDVRTPLVVLGVAVGFVLLIACFNVGGLQMERTLARRREMSLRLALGASRGRLVRQLLVENVVLALAGAVGGVAAASVTLGTLVALLSFNHSGLDEVTINGHVLLVTLAAASVAGIVAGLLPATQVRRANPSGDLAEMTRTTERRTSWTRRGLVIAEIALSVVVLIGAALMIQTFLTLRPSHPGFDPDRKLSLLVRLPGASDEDSARFFDTLFARLSSTPGILGVAGSTYLPMRGTVWMAPVAWGTTTAQVFLSDITTGYLDLMKIPIRAGRPLSADDDRGSEPVVLVNETFARRIQPNGQVLGQMISVPSGSRVNAPPTLRRIVGVVTNTRAFGSDTRSRSEAFIPYAQDSSSMLFVIAEAPLRDTGAAANELRGAVHALRPDLVVERVESIQDMVDHSVQHWRSGAWLLGVFAALAVVLAAVGLLTTIGWWVNQRTREIGVRVALGATRSGVTRLVLRQGLLLGVIGIVSGCATAAAVTRYLAEWIYGVTPLDAGTFAGCAAGMLLVSVLAIYVPVRRATAVDPARALRAD